jgi:hypothetical protein
MVQGGLVFFLQNRNDFHINYGKLIHFHILLKKKSKQETIYKGKIKVEVGTSYGSSSNVSTSGWVTFGSEKSR